MTILRSILELHPCAQEEEGGRDSPGPLLIESVLEEKVVRVQDRKDSCDDKTQP